MNKSLTISQVNRLFFASFLLVISLGTWFQTISFSWGLILTEIALILLPAIWILNRNQINLREYSGLQKTRASLILVAFMLGTGAWMVTSLVEQLMIFFTGYVTTQPAGIIPSSILQAIPLFIGFVIAAPVCEEILFRGTIQQTYQNRTSTLLSILVASLLFAFYHLRLQGLPSLLIISILLGFTYWRTQSLTFTIVLHAANNFLAFLVIIREGIFPELTLPFPSLQASAFGILMVVVGLVLLQRLLQRPQINRDHQTSKFFSLPVFWPILLSLVLFSIFAVGEVRFGKQSHSLQLNSHNFPVSAQWVYEIQHKGGDAVGIANCQWHLSESTVNLSCHKQHDAFETRIGNSFYSSMAMDSRLTVEWQGDNLDLSSLIQENKTDGFQSSWTIQQAQDDLIVNVQTQNASTESLTLSPQTLVQEEWGWRLMALPFEPLQRYTINYLAPLTWRESSQNSGPVIKQQQLVVIGQEEIQVPAGEFLAWKVTLNDGQTAWYSVDQPSILLRFNANMVDYLLKESIFK